MSTTCTTDQIEDKLLELVSGGAHSVSRRGIYITLGVIVLVFVLFAFVSHAISLETRKLETETQVAITQSISRQVERRMMTFSDRLGDLVKRHPNVLQCSDAVDLFSRYGEFVELSLITREGLVLKTCLTPSALDLVSREIAQFIPTAQTNQAIDQAKRLSSNVFSLPYARSKNGILYSDLIFPLDHERLYVARISLTTMLRQFTGTTLDYRYKIALLVDGKEISAASAEAQGSGSALAAAPSDNIRATSPLAPLPESVRLLTVNTHMDSAYGYTKLVRSIVLFGGLLLLATVGVLIYQYRQLKIEEELRARIIVQQAMSQSILDGLLVTDRLGKILYTNRAFNELFKDKPGEILGQTPPYLFCPQDKSIFDFKRHLQENASGDIVRAEFTALRKDDTRFICAAEILPLQALSSDQKQPGWLVTLRDVTQQKKSRHALALAHERTIRVLESMDSAVSVVATAGDNAGELLFANARYSEVFGHTAAAHLRLQALLKNQGPVNQGGEVYDETTRCWYFVGLRSITWMSGRQADLLTIQDITVKKAHEALLEQQMKNAEQVSRLMTMGELASSLAHELNQPLAAVQNYASATLTMLKARKLTEAGVETGLNKIINQTQRAAQIIKRIRGFAKRGEIVRTETPVARILDETMELAQMQAKKYGMVIELDLGDDGAANQESITCDPVLIEQVLINLLKNAMEASFESPSQTVRFVVRREGASLCFYIIDRGCGIDAERARRIFDPFYSTKRTGMGIGLNICRSIVESHHGRLSFEPNAEGGTIFKLSLPATSTGEREARCSSAHAKTST